METYKILHEKNTSDTPNLDLHKSIAHIEKLLLIDNQREAVELILSNNLQHHFQAVRTAQYILMPFWLKTGNTDKLVQYLKHQPALQSAFVCELDKCMKGDYLKVVRKMYNLLEKEQKYRLNRKPLQKLLRRLVREFNLNESFYPRLLSVIRLEHAKFQCERFKSKRMDSLKSIQFVQYLGYAQQHEPESYNYICAELLGKNNHTMDTVRLIRLLLAAGLPRTDWPAQLKHLPNLEHLIDQMEPFDMNESTSTNQRSDAVLTLPALIKPEFIDNPHKLKEAMDYLQKQTLIGIDEESNTLVCLSMAELLQMASAERVFVFDQPKLEANCPQIWFTRLYEIYSSDHIRKLAFGMANDMLSMPTYLGHGLNIASQDIHLRNGFCMRDLKKFELPIIESVESDSSGLPIDQRTSLTKMCERYLGVGLDKREQQSCWAARPLRQSQLYYAALDAHCLLRLYDHIHTQQ